MAETSHAEQVPSPSLFNSMRSFVGVLLATLCTRYDLAALEIEEQVHYGVQLVLSALAALFCVGTALFFLALLILVIFWDERILVLSIVLGVYVLGALIFGAIAASLLARRPKLLEQTLIELRKDVDGLRKPILTTEESS
jgi:uncharacterized membrane protein YqjE